MIQQPSAIRQQVIQRQDGFFSKSTEIIFNPELFKTPQVVQQEQFGTIAKKKPLGSWFSSIKIVNIQHSGTGAINISL